MQQEDRSNQFRQALAKIDHFYHVKEFKSLSQTKINHLKKQDKFRPPDYLTQIKRMFLHVVYLYYVSYIKKIDFYIYPHLCINKWGVIFRYYALSSEKSKFMTKVQYHKFKQNIKEQLINLHTNELQKQQSSQQKSNGHEQKQMNLWQEFFTTLIDVVLESEKSPKDILMKLQQTKHMRNNVFILGVFASTLFPCIKIKPSVQRAFKVSYEDEFSIVKKMFSKQYENDGTKDFVDSIFRFFQILNKFKILGITTTTSDRMPVRIQEGQSLLTQFHITLFRPLPKIEDDDVNYSEQIINKQSNQSSNKGSQQDYGQQNPNKQLGQLKCQFFWSRNRQKKQLNFRITVLFINKKIYPLYFNQIESIWYKICQKWKVILDEDKQLSGFNPGFLVLDYSKENYQLSLTDYVKYQPMQHILAELILATDKLIITALLMRDVICFYQKKSLSVQIIEEQLVVNEGRLQNMAQSVCQSIKNYYNYCKQFKNNKSSN